MKVIDNRLNKLEAEAPSEYVFNCMTDADLIRFKELISKKDHSEEEFQELTDLDDKAQRDARDEFLSQYDTTKPLNVRSVFNAFKEYQKEHARVNHLGYAVACCFNDFIEYLKHKGYELK